MKNYQFQLIDSDYNSEDASDLLMALVNEKIRFLKQKLSSYQEAENQAHYEKRISELKAELRTLELMLEEHDGEEADFGIRCSVQMSVRVPKMLA